MKKHLKLVPSPDVPATLLEITGLSKIYPEGGDARRVLSDINITALAGEFLCILGPSGCGKTTLLKLIAGFLPASSGAIRLNGKKIEKPGPDRCFVFQEDALFPWLTVAENIDFGLKTREKDRKKRKVEVDRYLDLVGLRDFRNHLPHQISGGMKQRVALARVLILSPHVLLMDEPFGALDAQTREEMQRLLLSLWKQFSRTIFFVTHDVTEAITLADRILILSDQPGRITADISVPLARPRNQESFAFHNFYRKIRSEQHRL